MAPHTLDAYLRLYEADFLAGTLPPVAQAAVVAAHKHFQRPLPGSRSVTSHSHLSGVASVGRE
jgi:hypothetical protein